MQIQLHPITLANAQPAYTLTSLHFGNPGYGKKVYIQASLHADEIPGMLVAQFLRNSLLELEKNDLLRAEIVLVPQANPLGLAQVIHGAKFGRFDLSNGINFNRGFKHVASDIQAQLEQTLGQDPQANQDMVRRHARTAIESWEAGNNAESLKKILLGLAIDADLVLDLHCDNEAVMHMYTGTPLQDAMAPLAQLIGAATVLLATESGDQPFDEACSSLWWDLQQQFQDRFPIPLGCHACTLELRGEKDISYELASQDAAAIIDFLAHRQLLALPAPTLPAAQCEASPLAGVEPVRAPHDGILIFRQPLGTWLAADSELAHLIDPVSGATTVIRNSMAGKLFARSSLPHVVRGMNIAKLAGPTAFRQGLLLSQ